MTDKPPAALALDEVGIPYRLFTHQGPVTSLRRHFGQSRLTLATPEEVLEQTGYQVGAVAPWGLPRPIPIYIEESVLQPGELSVGSGRRGTAILIQSSDFANSLPAAQTIVLSGA